MSTEEASSLNSKLRAGPVPGAYVACYTFIVRLFHSLVSTGLIGAFGLTPDFPEFILFVCSDP